MFSKLADLGSRSRSSSRSSQPTSHLSSCTLSSPPSRLSQTEAIRPLLRTNWSSLLLSHLRSSRRSGSRSRRQQSSQDQE